MARALDLFTPAARAWFEAAFEAPTEVQERGWQAVASGAHTLMTAPTGSGKTLAAFLWCLDRLAAEPPPPARERCRVLYLSPLKALAVDVERNLRAPLAGIQRQAERLGAPVPDLAVGIRTGDTPAEQRRQMERHPPDILITTPESLFLLLTSAARAVLASVRWVILDEIHAVASTKRGAHLALSLERLSELTEQEPQRIGLSATQRPLALIGEFLGGGRPVEIVDAARNKALSVTIEVPVDDMADLQVGAPPPELGSGNAAALGAAPPAPRRSIWPAIYPRLLDLVLEHRSTIVFVNARRAAERLAARLNELAADGGHLSEQEPELVLAHHGSLAREQRTEIEDRLKSGRLRGIVATSSLELGIDMGAVDLVVQVESPPSVAAGIQRIGRAGHHVGEVSQGTIFPKFRGDLLEAVVVVERMHRGEIEHTTIPRNPIDVLAQQIVAAVAMDEWTVADLHRLVTRALPFADLSRRSLEAVLDMLAGRYPSDEFSDLRPRLVWDRTADTLRPRAGAQRLAVQNPGTIPDRGLYTVNLLGDGRRVGELDEEMVFETHPGETFVLGATTWRVADITQSQVLVEPAPGEPGKVAFWHGDSLSRPAELGRAVGQVTRELRELTRGEATRRLREQSGCDERAAQNLLRYLDDQAAATGAVPDDRTIVVERFRDEVGDWRVCLLSPIGGRVLGPWALALQARLRERFGLEVQTLSTDDGLAIHLPDADRPLDPEDLLLEPEEIEDLVAAQLPGSALFAGRFRENAARALLLPRRRPGQRTPLWQQRQRSSSLLQVAGRHPEFPILAETYRECLADVFDLAALREILEGIRARTIRVVSVDTDRASPFAGSLLFEYVGQFLYDGDAPLAERRAQALLLDRELLADLLGSEDLRELLSADVIAGLELELQGLVPERWPRDPDEAHDLLARLGDLEGDELAARGFGGEWVAQLERGRRIVRVRIGSAERWIVAEDAARYRDALGVA
ncbi:MAG: DEAD/DEAH box helicase, partial [Candidatus Dormibacteraceae bacterium]